MGESELVVIIPSESLRAPVRETRSVAPVVHAEDLLPIVERALRSVRRASAYRATALPAIEKRGAAAVGRVFTMQKRAVLKRFIRMRAILTEDSSSSPIDPLWEESARETRDAMLRALQDAIRAAFAAGRLAAATTVGMGFAPNLVDQRALEYLAQHGAELVVGIDSTTRDQLAGVLTKAVGEGWSYKQTAQEISRRFDGFSVERAQLIATHEAALAYSEGQSAVAAALQAAGIPMLKEWITANDERVDSECSVNESAGPILFDDTFPSGDDMSPAHINCRCDVAVYPAS